MMTEYGPTVYEMAAYSKMYGVHFGSPHILKYVLVMTSMVIKVFEKL